MSAAIHRVEATLFADYFQFYLWDKELTPDAPTDLTDVDLSNRLKAAGNVVVICPIRNMTVPVTVVVFEHPIRYDSDPWDHIVECSLELPSGKLEVHECTGGSVATMELAPGIYRVCAYYGGLGTVSQNGLEGQDRYLIALWPAPSAQLQVTKRWCGSNIE
jgi:hypothetical protein